jgi:hypothetical protein
MIYDSFFPVIFLFHVNRLSLLLLFLVGGMKVGLNLGLHASLGGYYQLGHTPALFCFLVIFQVGCQFCPRPASYHDSPMCNPPAQLGSPVLYHHTSFLVEMESH